MRIRIRIPSFLTACGIFFATLALGGCASFQAVSGFGAETTAMTGTVRAEFRQLNALCTDEAGLLLAINGITDDRSLTACENFDRAQGQLARVTVDVLDGYAKALSALADDRAFSVSPGIRSVGAKVQALRDSSGDALVNPQGASALTAVAALLVDLAATAQREKAVRRMVEATPDLATSGRLLRSFFVVTPGVTAAGAQPPYANMVRIIGDSIKSTETALGNAAMRQAEPIRTAELLRSLRPARQALARRDPAMPDAVPNKVAAAIDAWLAALDQFARDAEHPTAAEWLARLDALRGQIEAARDAIDGV